MSFQRKQSAKIELIVLLFVAYLFIFVMYSCLNPEKYPPEPAIKFVKYTLIKNTIDNPQLENPVHLVILTFSFTDGDGDFGLNDQDTVPPHPACFDSTCNNLYIDKIGIKNGNYLDPLPYNYRIPVITPSGRNKALIGEIEVDDLFIYLNNGLAPYDTVFFEIYIIDRARNRSNIITTPEIVLNN